LKDIKKLFTKQQLLWLGIILAIIFALVVLGLVPYGGVILAIIVTGTAATLVVMRVLEERSGKRKP